MIRYIDFEKTTDGKWYLVLPGWMGDKEDLEMVMGADKMLDRLDFQGKNKITLRVTNFIPSDLRISLSSIGGLEIGGAFYEVHFESIGQAPPEIWLCDVIKTILGEFSEILYIEPINYQIIVGDKISTTEISSGLGRTFFLSRREKKNFLICAEVNKEIPINLKGIRACLRENGYSL